MQQELSETEIWNEGKLEGLKAIILSESQKQSPERKLRNELLAIKYRMQDYVVQEEPGDPVRILDFVKMYLKAMKITQRQLASAFGMKAANLYKYLTGERRLNADLVLKLSAFSHTQPELWYHIQTKNELLELRKEKSRIKEYEKYDYENFVSLVAEPRPAYGLEKKKSK